MCIIEKIVCLANTYVNLFVCLGVVVAIISFYADHRRRKKQATFEFYHGIYNEFIEPLNEIDKLFLDKDVISVDDAKKKDKLDEIKKYLSYMERFSVGINANIYDIKVFNRMIGATLTIEWYNKFRDIINFFKNEHKDENLYKDLEDLISKLRKKKKCFLSKIPVLKMNTTQKTKERKNGNNSM